MAGDDSTPGPEEFWPNEDERIIYLDAAGMGIFTLIPQNAVCFEIHAALLPGAWGQQSRRLLQGAVRWAFTNTEARRIVASIPAYNRLAIALAKRSGFTEFGRNPQSFLRGGSLHDQILLGVSKE